MCFTTATNRWITVGYATNSERDAHLVCDVLCTFRLPKCVSVFIHVVAKVALVLFRIQSLLTRQVRGLTYQSRVSTMLFFVCLWWKVASSTSKDHSLSCVGGFFSGLRRLCRRPFPGNAEGESVDFIARASTVAAGKLSGGSP